MAVSIPQVVTEDRASGALVVDGSLRFDNDKSQYLNRTFSDGNRRTFTFSTWIKRASNFGTYNAILSTLSNDGIANTGAWISDSDEWYYHIGSSDFFSNAKVRDTGWYHVVYRLDTTQSTDSDRLRIYVNGNLMSWRTGTQPSLNYQEKLNSAASHSIGRRDTSNEHHFDGSMSQFYFIDGQALGPEYFGYTDPLTNTWRPKKFKPQATPNNGTTWSSGAGSNFESVRPASLGFNGDPETFTRTDNASVTATVTLPSSIPFTTLQVRGARDGGNGTITINGVDVSSQFTSSSSTLETVTITGVTSPLTSIALTGISGSAQPRFSQIIVDGVTLIDGDTANIGRNGFYLPMDGNSPIGQDQSGNGNDWTPGNFGGSNTIEKATGAFPILNTGNGGTAGRPGVFGSEVSKNYTTTSNTAAGSGYEFDQTSGFNPSLSFVRGATYTFDYTDSSSHPLRFSSTDPDSSVTSYTDGTNTSVSNTVKITVPHNAPDTLYYYCTSHNSMNGSISVTTDTKKADPYAWKCVLAVPFVGSAVDVSASINCTTSNHTATVSGSVASSAQSNFYNGSFFFDGTDDTVSYAHSEDFHIGASDFTIEGWVWKDNKGSRQSWIGQRDGGSTEWRILFDYLANPDADSEGAVRMEWGSSQLVFTSNALKHSQWNHVAMVRSGTTGTLYINGISIGTHTLNDIGDYAADLYIGQQLNTGGENYQGYMNDIRIYKGVAKYTSTTIGEQAFIPASTNPDILPDTPSGVVTKTQLTKITDGAVSFDGAGDYLRVEDTDMAMGTGDFTVEAFIYNNSHASYRNYIGTRETGQGDPAGWCIASNAGGDLYVYSAGLYTNLTTKIGTKRWYHVAYVREGGTHKWYVDGILRGTDSTSRDYTDDLLTIGSNSFAGSEPVDGFISNVRVIKGTAIYTSNFTPPTAPLTNVTNTVLLCCQSKTSATAAAVTPVSITANGNAAATNFNPFTTDINTVRGQEGAYATLNPLTSSKFQSKTLKDGNLEFSGDVAAGSGYPTAFSNLTMNGVGKWYMEVYPFNTTDTSGLYFGICDYQMVNGGVTVANTYPGGPGGVAYAANGTIADNGSNTFTSQPTYTSGDTISVAYDADNGKVYFAKNGVYINGANPLTGANPHGTGRTGEQFFVVGCYNNRNAKVNFGQKPFKYAPPEGFQPLTSSTVRPDTVIPRPDQYFGIVAYTGDGNSPRKISGYNFAPDLIWYKQRNSARDHQLYDTVRGAGSNKNLSSNTTYSETANDDELFGYTSAFNDDGFTVTTGSSNFNYANASGSTYVAWTWKAGGSGSQSFYKDDVGYASAAAAGLTAGSITPTGASVGTKQGFSIIKWTGNRAAATVSHGLNSAVKFYFVKNLDRSSDWITWHTGLSGGGSGFIRLNTIGAQGTASTPWNSTIPTNSVFSLGADTESNGDGENMIAYLWHDVPGLQKFGSYTQNTNGVFVELGFKPALLVIKNADTQLTNSQWNVVDTQRDTYNPSLNNLAWDRSNSEPAVNAASYGVDILSNGFAIPSGNTGEAINSATPGGDTYIYAAWAEAPSFNLYGAQSNAR